MASRPAAKPKRRGREGPGEFVRVNLDLPSQARERLRNLAKAANEPEAVFARALLIDAIERAERAAFRKRLEASRTPERRARDLRAETLTVLSDPLFADRAVFGGPTPTDLAKKHDADLYGDLEYEALDRRMQSVRDGTATLVPWEKARTELLRRVSPRAAKELEQSLAVVRKRRVNRRKPPVL